MTAIPDLLRKSRVIAVVGLSSKRTRPSHGVAEYMQKQGYRIIPVNPNETEVLGEKSYARLEDIAEHIDIVDSIGASAIWMQEGVEDESAARKAAQAGLEVVMDRCILKEHRRYLR